MARTDERFREAYNALIEQLQGGEPGEELPSENALAQSLRVSRTIVRSALSRLSLEGIIAWDGRLKVLKRQPNAADFLPLDTDTVSAEVLERNFLEWILRFDIAPGTPLNVTELSRRFKTTPHSLQEFLASLTRFGLVRRGSKGGWELLGFTSEYAVELSDFRLLLELNAISSVLLTEDSHPIWPVLDRLQADHCALAQDMPARFHEFSMLDERFHAALSSVVENRFAKEFQKAISLVFHYHYQWDKSDELQRNTAAVAEHLRIIEALKQRNEAEALVAARDHIKTSKQTLLSSFRRHELP